MNKTAILINGFALVCLIISLVVDRRKTGRAFKSAIHAFWRIMPHTLFIIIVIGLLMAFISQAFISRVLGQQSGMIGVLIAASFGSVLHIPSIISFSLAALLLQQGAAVSAIATFIATLTMIGIVTLLQTGHCLMSEPARLSIKTETGVRILGLQISKQQSSMT